MQLKIEYVKKIRVRAVNRSDVTQFSLHYPTIANTMLAVRAFVLVSLFSFIIFSACPLIYQLNSQVKLLQMNTMKHLLHLQFAYVSIHLLNR